MSGESKKDDGEMAGDVATASTANENKKKKPRRGVMSRIWNGIFRSHGDDFEKRLQHISKEEGTVLARMKKRSHNRRKIMKHLILFSVLLEVIAVGYAIMTTRSLDLNWKMRALHVLPMFLFPGLSFVVYSTLGSFTRMCDRRDQKTLDRLRTERQAKIDELKERTNYYTTQQLIQRYDPDPAAKAAAATILASKLGADSGLKMVLGDESKLNAPTTKSHDVEYVQSSGLRNRKQLLASSSSADNTILNHSAEEMLQHSVSEGPEISKQNQMVVEHYHQTGSSTPDGGWIARIASLLVGEDPTQSYALICGNCHMHNGLARKEDFPYITYYCPHCNALNRPKQLEEHVSSSNSPNTSSPTTVDGISMIDDAGGSTSGQTPAVSSPVAATEETAEVKE